MTKRFRPLVHRTLSRVRIAVLGGDGRLPGKVTTALPANAQVFHYASTHNGGDGEARNLAQAIQNGGIDWVWILARWNGHTATRRIRRLCRRFEIPVKIIR